MEIFLRHIGDPRFQVGVGEDIGIHQTTVSNTFANVLNRIIEKADLWINFPRSAADIQLAKDSWLEKYTFPCAIGALDCTHIEYINRKDVALMCKPPVM
jgi:hypothetical protein